MTVKIRRISPAVYTDEQVDRVCAQGRRLLVDSTRNPAGQLNQGRVAHVQGDPASTRGATLSAPHRGYRAELHQYTMGTLPPHVAQSFTACSRAMLVICRDIAAALDDGAADKVAPTPVDFPWIRRTAPALGEVRAKGPRWPMLSDELRLLRVWLSATDPLWSINSGAINRDQFEAAVGAFIDCVLALHNDGGQLPTMSTDVGQGYWQALGGRVASLARQPRPASRRARAVWHWSRVAAPLLAAPEGALSATSGRWFLAAFNKASIDEPAMHAFRWSYVRQAVGTPADKTDPVARARTILQQLAESEPDNRWLERFGETPLDANGGA